MSKRETTPCKICGHPTRMLETRLCDICWELEFRMSFDPERTAKVLNHVPGLAGKVQAYLEKL